MLGMLVEHKQYTLIASLACQRGHTGQVWVC